MTNLLTLTPAEFCAATEACDEGREFALRHPTMADVWDACPRPDWLLWIVRKVNLVPDGRTLRLFAVWCARHTPLKDGRVTGDLITDPRLLAALDVAERHARGQATDAELIAARDAAADWDANADPAAHADAYAARAAYAAAYAAYAARAATYATADAAYGAGAAARAARAVRPARATARAAAYAASRAQADRFRRMVPNPFRKEAQP